MTPGSHCELELDSTVLFLGPSGLHFVLRVTDEVHKQVFVCAESKPSASAQGEGGELDVPQSIRVQGLGFRVSSLGSETCIASAPRAYLEVVKPYIALNPYYALWVGA